MHDKIIFLDIKNETNSSKIQYEEGLGPYILAQIAQRLGVAAVVAQDHLFSADPDQITSFILKEKTDQTYLAFSLLSPGVDLLLSILKKTDYLNLPIIIGGAGASIDAERIISQAVKKTSYHQPLVLVEGEAEDVFPTLLTTHPKNWYQITSVWRRNPDNSISSAIYQICDINKSPLPQLAVSHQRKIFLELIKKDSVEKIKKYNYLRSLINSQFEIGKGCYHRCGFCNTSCLQHQQVRKKSPQQVVTGMQFLYQRHGITFFSFTDNVAFDNPVYWFDFADQLQRIPENPFMFFGGYSSPHFLRDDIWLNKLLPLLYTLGLRSVIIGVQGGSKRILKDIIKRPITDPEDAIKITGRLVPLGINVKIDFIVGHPTETPTDLADTYQYMKTLVSLGGEVFVRKLRVIPHSKYALLLQQGYSLPTEDEKWNYWVKKIFALRRDDRLYRKIVLRKNVPNKYLIDRQAQIYYPHRIFDLETLSEHKEKLKESQINKISQAIYNQMFELLL